MSQRNLFTPLLVIAFLISGSASRSTFAEDKNQKPSESEEPSLHYTLKVGEKSVAIREGEAVRVDGEFNNPEVTITAQPYREFPYQGVSFKYPRTFTFEANVDNENFKNWTLSGNDFKIMYFVANGRLTTDEFADNLIDQFGRENCQTVKTAPLKFGDKQLTGTTLNVVVAGNKMVVNVYLVPVNETQTRLLVLQDNLDDAGNRSAEGKATLELLSQSAKLTP
ncbi:MAG: hypothetical protein U0795_16600 [Pirellulales bacterium]